MVVNHLTLHRRGRSAATMRHYLHYIEVKKPRRMAAIRTAADLVREAGVDIEHLSPAQVKLEITDPESVLIDIREAEEREQAGVIPGAVHAPRGMLEFFADPSSPYYRKEFDPEKKLILHCASGGRSALAAASLKKMGYTRIAHLSGGYQAWKEEGM